MCAVGAPEDAITDASAPRRIDGDGSIALVNAAASARVEQFVLVTSLGTGKFGLPAAALNLFWGILSQKRRAEAALEGSGMSYLIVRPGGMERPKDDYKESHNLVVLPRDSTFGGQVCAAAGRAAGCACRPCASITRIMQTRVHVSVQARSPAHAAPPPIPCWSAAACASLLHPSLLCAGEPAAGCRAHHRRPAGS